MWARGCQLWNSSCATLLLSSNPTSPHPRWAEWTSQEKRGKLGQSLPPWTNPDWVFLLSRRYHKCKACYLCLMDIRSSLEQMQKSKPPSVTGKFQEIFLLMAGLEWWCPVACFSSSWCRWETVCPTRDVLSVIPHVMCDSVWYVLAPIQQLFHAVRSPVLTLGWRIVDQICTTWTCDMITVVGVSFKCVFT